MQKNPAKDDGLKTGVSIGWFVGHLIGLPVGQFAHW